MSIHTSIKPAGDKAAAAYAPQRDMAYLFPALMAEVFLSMDEKNWTPEVKEFLEKNDVTESDLAKGVGAFMDALRFYIRHPEIKNVLEAMTQAKVEELPVAVRQHIFSRLGYSAMCGFFDSARQATFQGELATFHDFMVSTIGSAQAVMAKLQGSADVTLVYDKAVAAAQKREFEAVLSQKNNELLSYASALTRFDHVKAELDFIQDKTNNFFKRTYRWLKLAMSLPRT